MLLAKYERIYADPFESVDIYTRRCSVGVNVAQLARMGATLANNGVNPITGERVIKREHIPYILSAMTMAKHVCTLRMSIDAIPGETTTS